MPRIFLSHSSEDSRAAVALKQWLVTRDPTLDDDIFLDVDPRHGMVGGEQWKQTLARRLSSCEALLCLVSESWERRPECVHEYRGAEDAGKQIFIARLDAAAGAGAISAWQRRDLFVNGGAEATLIDIGDGGPNVEFSGDGLDRLLRDVRSPDLTPGSFQWPPKDDTEREPYRGWMPFESLDAGVFFGRDAELSRALKSLREVAEGGGSRLFVVLGASGTGKSSFLRAGILPRLALERRRFVVMGVVRPGRGEAVTGELGLAASICEGRKRLGLDSPSFGEMKATWVQDSQQLRGLLIECQQRATQLNCEPDDGPPTIILPLDQAEELVSAEAGKESAVFLALLRDLMTSVGEPTPLRVVVVATIRTDQYAAMQTLPELAGIDATFSDLRPMPPGRFREVIEGPAARSTQSGRPLAVDPDLVNRLFEEAANLTQGGDTLPLLSLTLYRMFQNYASTRHLTLQQFNEMGGMAHIVRNEIDRLLSKDPDKRREELRLLRAAFVPWLATVSGSNQPLRRIALWSDIPEASREVVSRFVEARLLIRDKRAMGGDAVEKQDVVEVALESLLRQWQELAQWLDEQREDLQAADHLIQEAAAWQANDRDDAYLFEGKLLSQAEALYASTTFARKLEPVRDFVVASRQREQERQEEAKRHAEAELQATRDRLAAAREQQQITELHASALRRRDRVLRALLAITVVVALVAAGTAVWALTSRRAAVASAKEATAQRLVPVALDELNDAREGDDVQAFQELLAANALASQGNSGPVVDALLKRFSTIRIGTANVPVIGVAYADVGHQLAVADSDGNIRLWDTDSAEWQDNPLGGSARMLPPPADGSRLTSIAMTPDGQRILAGTQKGQVMMWNTASTDPPTEVATHSGRVFSVAFSRQGDRIATASADKTIQLIDLKSNVKKQIPVGSEVLAVAFDPTGTRIASGSADGTIRLWGARDGAPIKTQFAHPGGAMAVTFDPSGHVIATGGNDSAVRLWTADGLQPLGEMSSTFGGGHKESVVTVAFNADGTRLVSGGNDLTVQLWDVRSRQRIGDPMRGHEGIVESVVFIGGRDQIVSGGNDHEFRLWDAKVGIPISESLSDHRGPVTSVAVSADRVASATADGTVQLWNADTGALVSVSSPQGGPVSSVAFNSRGDVVASGATDGTITLRRAGDGKDIRTLTTAGPVYAISFDPRRDRLVSASGDGQLTMWDTDSGVSTQLPKRDDAVVSALAFDPSGDRMVSGNASGVLRLWQADGTELWERDIVDALPADKQIAWAGGHPGVITSVAFSPDGTRVASGGATWSPPDAFARGMIQRWDAKTGDIFGEPLTVADTGTPMMGVVFSPQGGNDVPNRIVSGGMDRTVRVWDADNAGVHQVGEAFSGHPEGISTVAVSPDGRRIVSGSADGSIRIWANPPARDPAEALCAKLTTNMNDQQWKNWVSDTVDYQTAVCPGLTAAASTG